MMHFSKGLKIAIVFMLVIVLSSVATFAQKTEEGIYPAQLEIGMPPSSIIQQVAFDKFYTNLPLAITINQFDKVKVRFAGYPEQEITISGEFQHIFYQSSEDPNIIYAMLTGFELTTTSLFIPGYGTVELELTRNKGEISFGTLYLNSRKFHWEANLVVKIVGTENTFPVQFLMVDNVSYTETGLMTLAASGSGGSIPVFGGVEFSFVPGSGCESKKSSSTELGTFRNYLDVIIAGLSGFDDMTVKSAGAMLNGISQSSDIAAVAPDDIIDKILALQQVIKVMTAPVPDETKKAVELVNFYHELYQERLITAVQLLALFNSSPIAAEVLDKSIDQKKAIQLDKQIDEYMENWRKQQAKK